ncbi:unnamed protein product [Boreogadus saida]
MIKTDFTSTLPPCVWRIPAKVTERGGARRRTGEAAQQPPQATACGQQPKEPARRGPGRATPLPNTLSAKGPGSLFLGI